jgi:hypothetical protein
VCIHVWPTSKALPDFPQITINGQPATARRVSGAGDIPAGGAPGGGARFRYTDTSNWSIHSIDLTSHRGKRLDIVAVSSKNAAPFLLDAWVVADRPVNRPPARSARVGLPGNWRSCRRESARLLSYALSVAPLRH